jgi:hypothetical protein
MTIVITTENTEVTETEVENRHVTSCSRLAVTFSSVLSVPSVVVLNRTLPSGVRFVRSTEFFGQVGWASPTRELNNTVNQLIIALWTAVRPEREY